MTIKEIARICGVSRGTVDRVVNNRGKVKPETEALILKTIEEMGYTMPVYFDTQFIGNYIYGIRAYPTTFFIDEKGQVVAYANQAIDAQTLQRGIDMIT